MEKGSKSILIIAATAMEINPLLEYLQQAFSRVPDQSMRFERKGLHIRVAICGIGMLATAFHLGQLLKTEQFDGLIQLGIAGAYPTDKISLGDVVYINTDRIGDLGATTHEGDFLDMAGIGLQEPSAMPLHSNPPAYLQDFLQQFPDAESITVNHISGDPAQRNRLPIAAETIVTESMEGAAFHYACIASEQPFVQIRSISNWVEPRDKSRWQMGIALQNLNKTAIDLLQHL